jgi:HAMP domain-containing protein
MIQVALAAFGLTGVIMVLAVLMGLVAGAAIIWFRRQRPVTTIEARGHEHNLFRA